MKPEESASDVMDETMAAMVLTSLSGSPTVPPAFTILPDRFKFRGKS